MPIPESGVPVMVSDVEGLGEADLLDGEPVLALGGEGGQGGDGFVEEIGADEVQNAAERRGQRLGRMGLDGVGDSGEPVVEVAEVAGEVAAAEQWPELRWPGAGEQVIRARKRRVGLGPPQAPSGA
ncbi:MAG: hypothetical protein GY722_26200 [bacterium]|nr:hypothetical protein [bacterium]